MANGNTQPSSSTTTPQDTRRTKELGKDEFKRHLRGLKPVEFERFVADIWDLLKDGSTTLSERSGDMGIDVLVTDGSETEVIQVKRYGSGRTVGRPEVQKYYALYDQENADRVTIVTTEGFTDEAQAWAAEYGITLYDSDDLYEIIRDAGLSQLLADRYLAGEYRLVDRESRILRPFLRTIASIIIRLVITVVSFARPIWAAILLVMSAVIAVGATAEIILGPIPFGAEAFIQQYSEFLVSDLIISMFAVSLFAYPASLYWLGEGRKAIIAAGFLVGTLGLSFASSSLQGFVFDSVTLVIFTALFVFSTADFYSLCWQKGLIQHSSESLKFRFNGRLNNNDGDERPNIQIENYATISANRR